MKFKNFTDTLLEDYDDFDEDEVYGYITMIVGDGGDDICYIGYSYDEAADALRGLYPDWSLSGLGGGDTDPAIIEYYGDRKLFDDIVKQFNAGHRLSSWDLKGLGYTNYRDLWADDIPGFHYIEDADDLDIKVELDGTSITPKYFRDYDDTYEGWEIDDIIKICRDAGCTDIDLELADGSFDSGDIPIQDAIAYIRDIYKLDPAIHKNSQLYITQGPYVDSLYGSLDYDDGTEIDVELEDIESKADLINSILMAQDEYY